jgi:orotate phosphoribosyltransferase
MAGTLKSAAELFGIADSAALIRSGHFAYESGDHGDAWLDLELLFADPRRLQRAAARLAESLRGRGAEIVCAPLVGGALVGQWVAYELGVGFVFAERRPNPEEGVYAVPSALRPLLAGKQAIVVDDAINAGSAASACAFEIRSCGGSVAAVASLIARDSAAATLEQKLGVPLEALLTLGWNLWPAAGCPLCRSGMPLTQVD